MQETLMRTLRLKHVDPRQSISHALTMGQRKLRFGCCESGRNVHSWVGNKAANTKSSGPPQDQLLLKINALSSQGKETRQTVVKVCEPQADICDSKVPEKSLKYENLFMKLDNGEEKKDISKEDCGRISGDWERRAVTLYQTSRKNKSLESVLSERDKEVVCFEPLELVLENQTRILGKKNATKELVRKTDKSGTPHEKSALLSLPTPNKNNVSRRTELLEPQVDSNKLVDHGKAGTLDNNRTDRESEKRMRLWTLDENRKETARVNEENQREVLMADIENTTRKPTKVNKNRDKAIAKGRKDATNSTKKQENGSDMKRYSKPISVQNVNIARCNDQNEETTKPNKQAKDERNEERKKNQDVSSYAVPLKQVHCEVAAEVKESLPAAKCSSVHQEVGALHSQESKETCRHNDQGRIKSFNVDVPEETLAFDGPEPKTTEETDDRAPSVEIEETPAETPHDLEELDRAEAPGQVKKGMLDVGTPNRGDLGDSGRLECLFVGFVKSLLRTVRDEVGDESVASREPENIDGKDYKFLPTEKQGMCVWFGSQVVF